MKKRMFSLLLAALFCLSVFVSCSESKTNTDGPAPAQTADTPAAAEDTPVEDDETAELQPDIPALDFPPPLLAEGRARLDQVLSAASTSPAPAAPIALHPGAGAPGKRWPLDGYLAVAHALQRRHLPVLWILGEADADLADALDQALPDAPRLRNLPLTDLAPALAHCRAYLGNDSGIAHLAAALPPGCPRALHLRKVLHVRAGQPFRAGLLDGPSGTAGCRSRYRFTRSAICLVPPIIVPIPSRRHLRASAATSAGISRFAIV